MAHIPEDKTFDSSLKLLKDGYQFISKKRAELGTDIFQTRIMLKKTICMNGKDAAEIFYDSSKFKRKGAAPKRIQETLLGEKGIQTLDNSTHRIRKEVFMELMSPQNLSEFLKITGEFWETYLTKWQNKKKITLFDEVKQLLFESACHWSGVPIQHNELKTRSKEMSDMVYSFGAVGPRHWKGRRARERSEEWIVNVIKQIRHGKLTARKETAAYKIAFHKEGDGSLMNLDIAAVELINVLRPITAIATYITFIAHALHKNPHYQKKIADGVPDMDEMFVQEVRRLYPFTPLVAAIVRETFTWKNYIFPKGRLVLLDIYGMLHDSKLWNHPHEFYPERFVNWEGDPYTLIPQGGGEYLSGHRCAGEWLTIQCTKQALNFLTSRMLYTVPKQDLSINLSRMPTFPESGFVMEDVEKIDAEFWNKKEVDSLKKSRELN